MNRTTPTAWPLTRRDLLRAGLCGIAIGTGLPMLFRTASSAFAAEALTGGDRHPERILVVVELSGGNDGLNTIVPYGDDAYYRHRPMIGIPPVELRRIDDHFGFHRSLKGLEALYQDGRLAIVHGCGYDNPTESHFAAMGYWHTGVPNGVGEKRGWIGRTADAMFPEPQENLMVNIASTQSLAVRSRVHSPLVFDDPDRFRRDGRYSQRPLFAELTGASGTGNDTLDFLGGVAETAVNSSAFIRDAWAAYRTQVDYGLAFGLAVDLQKVAALIDARMPTRFYYASVRNNAFDTHVHQVDTHARLLAYTADALRGFLEDVERIGRADDVVVMVFTEFGRRVAENASGGTDHGTATPMFVIGKPVKGGFYGEPPSLTDLADGNLIKTTDFRSVYATMIEEWMGFDDSTPLLHGRFPTLGMIA